MANATELKSKFTDLLKSMFQLDQPELDFGLYRIMHAKAERINRFLDTELAQQIDAVFDDANQSDQNQAIEAAKQKLISQLGYGAFDEHGELAEHFRTVPAAKEYLNAVEKAKAGKGNLSERAVIYDHLIRFFKRYYDGGDFMSRRYHVAENKSRAAAYAVPYDGSEVYLHWANKDQYYIKTTESFNLYSFDIAEAAKKHAETSGQLAKTGLLDFEEAPELANKRIHFKLVDAAQGEHNNNKESEKRQFFIRAEHPVALNEDGELEVYFEFRVATKADTITAEKEKQLKSRFGASNKGDLPNLYITQVIQDALSTMQTTSGVEDFVTFAQILAPTDKVKQRPLITKYINNYTSKNTMDYFIHKDLGGFLQRELDFYIKNEIMRLDDIEQADDTNYARLLKQIKTLRGVAKDIIQFLAQLENFQKKLWLKKKFVTETNYCFTLDQLADEPELIDIALSNEDQRKEWAELLKLDLKELDEFRQKGIESLMALGKFQMLVIDTRFFTSEFKETVLSTFDFSEGFENGILINSDNFQALGLLKNKFHKSVNCIHIDPPYNTATSGFLYKNTYKHSSWLSMMNDRFSIAKDLMSEGSDFFCHIDENEYESLKVMLSNFEMHDSGTIIWDKKNPMLGRKGVATQHEYILNFNNYEKSVFVRSNAIEQMRHKASELLKKMDITSARSSYANWIRENDELSGGEKAYKYLSDNGEIYRLVAMGAPEERRDPKYFVPLVHPITKRPCPVPPNGWSRAPETLQKLLDEGLIVFGKDEQTQPQKIVYLRDDSKKQLTSVYRDGKSGKKYMDALGLNFPYSHPVSMYEHFASVASGDGIHLDYFAGSGTSGNAVINLNKSDGGNRQYLLIEMGSYFDSVTKPRIQKVIYAENWNNGSPVFDNKGNAGGVSQCFKYLRLEQYEDTLNNLLDSRTYTPDAVPKDFMLSYLLDAETAESPSLLNLEQFSHPRQYKLKIKRPNSDQSSPQVIDLVETFNWLIGLHVEKLDKWRAYDCEFQREHDPELPQDQNTRLKVTHMKQANAYAEDAPVYQVRTVEGWVRQVPGSDELRDKVLVIWRNLSDDPEKDSAFLEALLEKWKINQSDSQFDKIYINGPHGLQLRGSAKTRLLSLEDTFMTKMWEDA